MTRKEAALGVCPARLVFPWRARGIDSTFREHAKSGAEEQEIVENVLTAKSTRSPVQKIDTKTGECEGNPQRRISFVKAITQKSKYFTTSSNMYIVYVGVFHFVTKLLAHLIFFHTLDP